MEDHLNYLKRKDQVITAELSEIEGQDNGVEELVDKIAIQIVFEELEQIPIEQRGKAVDVLVKGEIKVN